VTGALLLAHGAGGSVQSNFGALLSARSGAVPAFGPDFPGSGRTPPARVDLHLDDLADQIVAAAAAVPRFAILGYSMGCAVAVRVATRYPERVSALVLTAGGPRLDDATRARITQWRELIDGDRQALAGFIMSVMFSDSYVATLTDRQRRDFLDLFAWTVPPGSGHQVELVQRIDVTAELPLVTARTLVIGTNADRLVSPVMMREYATGIPGAHWAELDSGHAVAVEQPARWARLVDTFLGEA
jgi:pimeloyl-ACP methyl ester carboxylesterase